MDEVVEKIDEKVELDNSSIHSNYLKETPKVDEKKVEGVDNSTQSSNKKRKPKEVAIFGNYRNYYGYRIDQGVEEDPRIKVLKKEWFEGKDCLDIGCNSGLITITIAKKFCCRSIHGVDIDSARIEDAYWNLRNTEKRSSKKPRNASKLEDSNGVNGIENSATEPQSEVTTENSVGSSPSTTLSDKGGILILEPQPWISYSNNRQVSEIGFRMVEDLTCGLSGSKSGFRRPILAFWK
ncbi:hypothetical protein LguiA_020007 [Lonicera macranthoides]